MGPRKATEPSGAPTRQYRTGTFGALTAHTVDPTSLGVRLRAELGRYLVGHGVELGPGHNPYPLPLPGTTVEFVDRWEPSENSALFPELGDEPGFPEPHHIANLDTDRLQALADGSQDFVIASHVLEHMAEPIGLIDDVHRVLRVGGVALVLLPDRRRTFDSTREPTTLEHLVATTATASWPPTTTTSTSSSSAPRASRSPPPTPPWTRAPGGR